MADVFTKEKRSDVMSRIRGRGNESTEILLARAFKAINIRGWRRHLKSIEGKPDFAFTKQRVAVFVDGVSGCGGPPLEYFDGTGSRAVKKLKRPILSQNRRSDKNLGR